MIVFGSARNSYLKAFDAIHHQNLWSFSSISSRQFVWKANEPPLTWFTQTQTYTTVHCVFNPQFENLYDKNKICIKSIGLRIQKHIDDSNIPLDIIKPVSHSKIPPWKLLKPKVDTSLSEFKKT